MLVDIVIVFGGLCFLGAIGLTVVGLHAIASGRRFGN